MTAKSVVFGRKAVILAVVISVAAMFVTSFMYRMDNPNLFVKGQQPSSMSGEGATPPPGMGQGGGMARVKEFMARVEENPNDVKALVNLGNSFLMMRAWDRALEPLEKANELKPGNTDVLKAIGIAYFNKEDFTKASAFYEQILKIDPADTLAMFNLGVIYKHYFKKPVEARKYFEKVLKLEKNDAEMRKLAAQELEK